MFNLFDAAKTVLNSVSSTNLFPWNFIDPNHGPFQLPAQMTRKIEYRPLERKRKINQIETNLTKKLKPTPIIEEVLPPSLPLVSQVVSPKSPQISSCTCSHTPPASPLQSPLKVPLKTPIEPPIESPIQSPEKPHQPEIIIEEVVLSSSPSTPHTRGLKSTSPCTRSQSPPATPVQSLLQSPEKPHEPTIIIEEVDLSSSPSSPSTPTSHTMGLKSPSTSPCNRLQSPPATPVQPALQSPEKPHEPTITIEEVDLSSPSSCASSRSPLQSPEKIPQPTTPVKEDFVSSQSNTAPQTMEIKKLSPSKLSILSLQNLEFFSSNSELLNKLTNNFDYNQFKDTLKSPFDTIMFYLLVEAKASLDSASAINLFPWNFEVFHISFHPREPHQSFSSIHGNLPVPYKTVCDDFQRKVSIVVIENRKRFICKNDLCNHGNKKFSKKEKVISHLYKKYVLFVCVACGDMFHQRSTLNVHQTSHCRFRKKLKAPDNDIKNEDDKVIEDENDSDGEKNVDMKTEEEDFKILIQNALKRAHEDGLLIQFEEIEALINALSNDFKSMSFLVLLARIIMCQEEKYGLERDELHCHDDYYKIWMDTERCFQIVELATKKAVSIQTLESRVQQGVSKGWRDFVCAYPFCRCSGEFRRKTKLEVVSHIEQSNYRLVCCGCHSSFKVISSLIRHSNDSCKHSKLLDEMKERTKK